MNELYVASRQILLDALIALEPHRDSIILVGAQAVYVHAGEGQVAVAPYTADGDLVIDPSGLDVEPDIEAVMRTGGFSLSLTADRPNPGAWLREIDVDGHRIQIPIDLMVPEAVIEGRRAAQLAGHSTTSARRVRGLEAALVDNDWHELGSLAEDDPRIVRVRVAGPTALLLAKAFKINDRFDAPKRRQDDKDALDCYRLMLTTPNDVALRTLSMLAADQRSAASVAEGVDLVRTLFGAPRSRGTTMAIDASEGLIPPARIRTVCVSFAAQLA